MAGHEMDNVVLLPQTVEYYQVELTRMLESERYTEAIELLGFLLGCHKVDEQTDQEWHNLLQWLKTMFPEHIDPSSLNEEVEETEADLYREHLKNKTDHDHTYTENLLDMLRQEISTDKQILALEQLTYIEHPRIDETLIKWLCDNELHPLIQFKALQSLKTRGAAGTIQIPRNGDLLTVEIEETPLNQSQFPIRIKEIMTILQERSEMTDPEIASFASQVWDEFLAFYYGTPTYRFLADQGPEAVSAWAAALHAILQEMLHGTMEREYIWNTYGITTDLHFIFEQAYRTLQYFRKMVYRLNDS